MRDPRTRGLRVATLPSHQGASTPGICLQQAVHDEPRVPRTVELPTDPPSFQLPRLRPSPLTKFRSAKRLQCRSLVLSRRRLHLVGGTSGHPHPWKARHLLE